MDYSQYIQNAQQHIAAILEKQFARIEKMKAETAFTDYSKLSTIKIGIVGGEYVYKRQLIRRTSENTSDEVIDSVMNELTDGTINQLVVTPKDIDALTNDISHIIASAMNKVFATEAFLS